MTKIYDQHRAAFSNVSAFVVLGAQGQRVATVAIKFPRDGAGRLYAYVHWIGCEMVRGFAGGYGYDKRTAAVQHAAKLIRKDPKGAVYGEQFEAFLSALDGADAGHWDRALENAGFTVLQAV